MIRNWMKMLFAILAGNVVYFLIIKLLPDALAHRTFRIDAGLFLDMAICAVIYVLISKVR